jgi:hypothetical protein
MVFEFGKMGWDQNQRASNFRKLNSQPHPKKLSNKYYNIKIKIKGLILK